MKTIKTLSKRELLKLEEIELLKHIENFEKKVSCYRELLKEVGTGPIVCIE